LLAKYFVIPDYWPLLLQSIPFGQYLSSATDCQNVSLSQVGALEKLKILAQKSYPPTDSLPPLWKGEKIYPGTELGAHSNHLLSC